MGSWDLEDFATSTFTIFVDEYRKGRGFCVDFTFVYDLMALRPCPREGSRI